MRAIAIAIAMLIAACSSPPRPRWVVSGQRVEWLPSYGYPAAVRDPVRPRILQGDVELSQAVWDFVTRHELCHLLEGDDELAADRCAIAMMATDHVRTGADVAAVALWLLGLPADGHHPSGALRAAVVVVSQ